MCVCMCVPTNSTTEHDTFRQSIQKTENLFGCCQEFL